MMNGKRQPSQAHEREVDRISTMTAAGVVQPESSDRDDEIETPPQRDHGDECGCGPCNR